MAFSYSKHWRITNNDILKRIIETRSMPEPNTGCWLWIGSFDLKGYGKLNVNGKVMQAHRASYTAFNGTIKTGKVIRHACDVPSCVNPDHLISGSHFENCLDRVRCYHKNKTVKLSIVLVNEIQYLRNSGMRYVDLANMYNVAPPTIRKACIGDTWNHAKPPKEN